MSTDLMLDMETLATGNDAVILTFGAIKFDPYSDTVGANMYFRINVDEQLTLGREVNDSTLEWWSKQNDDVREEAMGDGEDRISLDQFTIELNRFLVGCKNVWAQGTMFDIGILEHLYKQIGKPVPWQFWQIRDSRTLLSVLGDPRDKNAQGAHNALADAVSQAVAVQEVIKKYNIKENK